MPEEMKRRHHYVWKHYLLGWDKDGTGRVWCQRGTKRYCTNVDNVAVESDFYRLQELGDSELMVLRLLIKRLPDHAQESAAGWLQTPTLLHAARRALAEKTNLPEVVQAEMRQQIEVAINNTDEDLHGRLETDMLPILASLRLESTSAFDDAALPKLLFFTQMQNLRTKGRMAAMREGLAHYPFDVEAVNAVLRNMLAETSALSLFLSRTKMRATFIRAPDNVEFITGDQPIMNLRADQRATKEPPTELELYYPLSPKLGLTMYFDHHERVIETKFATLEELSALNQLVLSKSHEQIFATSEAVLATVTRATIHR